MVPEAPFELQAAFYCHFMAVIARLPQGHRLFQKSELNEEAVRLPCEAIYCGGDINGVDHSSETV